MNVSQEIHLTMTPPPLWQFITVREPLPEHVRDLILRYSDLTALEMVMERIFRAAREMPWNGRRMEFEVVWSMTETFLDDSRRLRAVVERDVAGVVRVSIVYSLYGGVYSMITVRADRTFGCTLPRCAVTERILSGG